LGFVLVVGCGGLWLFVNTVNRKRLLRSLLSLPEKRRFFWYKLRKDGFEVVDYDKTGNFSVFAGDDERQFSLKVDFIAKRNRKRYACLFSDIFDEKELLKIFFVYLSVFNVDGVIFYDEERRGFTVWQL